MRLPRVTSVLVALPLVALPLLAGCSAAPSLALGGTGIEACIPNPEDAQIALSVPLENSGDDAQVVVNANASTGNASFDGAYFVGGFEAASDDTLASLIAGHASEYEGLADGMPAEAASVPAHSRGELVFTFTPTSDEASVQAVSIEYAGGTLTATPTVTSTHGTCP
jgi:hypothetical protein